MKEDVAKLMHATIATAAVIELLVNPPTLVSKREWEEHQLVRCGVERTVRRLERYLGRMPS